MKLIYESPDEASSGKRCALKREGHKLLETFAGSKEPAARVEFTEEEYKSAYSARAALSKTAKYHKIDVRVRLIEGEIYLDKT